MSPSKRLLIWALRLIAAFIMIQSLFFKFSAAPESVFIFSTLGMEPWGRIGTGIIELIASILILIPVTSWAGALVGAGTMLGAVVFHLTKLGIEVQGDGGQLFLYAMITFICCLLLAVVEWSKISNIYRLVFSK